MKHWQEDGIRLGGGLLDENEAKRLVKELKKKNKGPFDLGRDRRVPCRNSQRIVTQGKGCALSHDRGPGNDEPQEIKNKE